VKSPETDRGALEKIGMFTLLVSPEYDVARAILMGMGMGKDCRLNRCARRFLGKGESLLNVVGSVVL
jgi:hypothetical protein